MQLYKWKILIILYSNIINTVISFELVSMGTAAIVGAGSFVGSFLYQKTVCNFKECCTDKQIPADFDKLETFLKERVYGQHLANELVVNALRSHWHKDFRPQKALTLSFHGWPGGGKNYIAGFIKESLYASGSESIHIHHFIGRTHFPRVDKIQEYQMNLYHWLKGNVSRCSKQLIIFDEVDKMPPKLLDIIKPLIDYNQNVDKVDYRDSIFLFLSNTGESLIIDETIRLWKAGVRREDIKIQDFERLITKGAFNEKGGFYHSDTIKSNLIDHYIPFLPLENEHVRLCILDQFKLRHVFPKDEHVQELLDSVEWGPFPEKLFSQTGCKRLSQKVAVLVQQYYKTRS